MAPRRPSPTGEAQGFLLGRSRLPERRVQEASEVAPSSPGCVNVRFVRRARDGERGPEELAVDVNGLTTRYLVAGGGPPLVLVHDVGESNLDWR